MKFLTFPAIQLSERQQAKLNTQNKFLCHDDLKAKQKC